MPSRRDEFWRAHCNAGGCRRHICGGYRPRRWLPAALIQSVQRVVHNRVIAVAVANEGKDRTPPVPVRIASRVRALRTLAGYGVAIGPLPEHAPTYARR